MSIYQFSLYLSTPIASATIAAKAKPQATTTSTTTTTFEESKQQKYRGEKGLP